MSKEKTTESAISGLEDAVVDIICDEIIIKFEAENFKINENKLKQIINKNYKDFQNKILSDIRSQIFKKKSQYTEVIKKRRIVELGNESIENRTERND